MQEEEFIDTVRQEGPFESREEARDVTSATLRTLGERITDGAAADVTPGLPENVGEMLTEDVPTEAEPFSLDEFTARVSDRAGVDESDVIPGSQAVATAVSRAAEDELDLAREQLPSEFDVIFEPDGPSTADEFLETVGERANLDSRDAARDAASATLRTLGERFSAGEATDLALYLPETLGEELVYADEETTTDYSFDKFVRRVSQREGVEKADAETHARAVGSTLADAASMREIGAARKQLPDPFGKIFDPPDVEDG